MSPKQLRKVSLMDSTATVLAETKVQSKDRETSHCVRPTTPHDVVRPQMPAATMTQCACEVG